MARMKILSITAGAAGMYCGSCFRDNALAAELMARGHDVTLLPLYTPTRTDEPNVSRRPRALRRHQRLPAAARRRSSGRRRGSSIGCWDSPWRHQRVRQPVDLDRPAAARRSDDLDARRASDGVLRKEFDKLLEWMRDEPLPDVINLPNSLLIGLARPLREALERPVCCTLQGEELFLDGLLEPYRDAGARADSQPGAGTSIASSPSATTTPAFMSRAAADSAGADRRSCRSASTSTGYERRRRRATTCSASATSRGRAGEGAARPGRGVRAVPARAPGDARVRLEAAGYLAPATQPYLDGRASARSSAAGLGGEFTYHGAVDRDGKLAFLREPRRALGAGDLRRAEGHVPARSDGERRAGRAAAARRVHRDRREDRRRPARRSPTIPTRSPTGSTRSGRTARCARTLGRARVRRRARALHASRSRPIACSTSTRRCRRATRPRAPSVA